EEGAAGQVCEGGAAAAQGDGGPEIDTAERRPAVEGPGRAGVHDPGAPEERAAGGVGVRVDGQRAGERLDGPRVNEGRADVAGAGDGARAPGQEAADRQAGRVAHELEAGVAYRADQQGGGDADGAGDLDRDKHLQVAAADGGAVLQHQGLLRHVEELADGDG